MSNALIFTYSEGDPKIQPEASISKRRLELEATKPYLEEVPEEENCTSSHPLYELSIEDGAC